MWGNIKGAKTLCGTCKNHTQWYGSHTCDVGCSIESAMCKKYDRLPDETDVEVEGDIYLVGPNTVKKIIATMIFVSVTSFFIGAWIF